MAVPYQTIIQKYIPADTELYRLYTIHVTLVTNKALTIGRQLKLKPTQLQFIEEAAMLHDIGIIRTDTPELFCFGKLPYICHGVEGRKITEAKGLPVHALVCERHTGVGLRKADIIDRALPLPHRSMLPISIEEKIICWADLFYSKNPRKLWLEKPLEQVEAGIAEYGSANVAAFQHLKSSLSQ